MNYDSFTLEHRPMTEIENQDKYKGEWIVGQNVR